MNIRYYPRNTLICHAQLTFGWQVLFPLFGTDEDKRQGQHSYGPTECNILLIWWIFNQAMIHPWIHQCKSRGNTFYLDGIFLRRNHVNSRWDELRRLLRCSPCASGHTCCGATRQAINQSAHSFLGSRGAIITSSSQLWLNRLTE